MDAYVPTGSVFQFIIRIVVAVVCREGVATGVYCRLCTSGSVLVLRSALYIVDLTGRAGQAFSWARPEYGVLLACSICHTTTPSACACLLFLQHRCSGDDSTLGRPRQPG